jgi:hypothetical protein
MEYEEKICALTKAVAISNAYVSFFYVQLNIVS